MKKHLFNFLIVITLAIAVSAQKKEAELYDEFGYIECEDLRQRLDMFMVELINRPDARGYFITYDGKYRGKLPVFGETHFRTQMMIEHFKFRNFPMNRVMFINGGYREDYINQLFIVPKGAKPPKPEPTLDEIKYRKAELVGIICNEG